MTAVIDAEALMPFLAAIAARPGDHLPRLILVDWLEEHGLDAEAAGQRWAVVRGKWPQTRSRLMPGWSYRQAAGFPPEHACLLWGFFAVNDALARARGSNPADCERQFLVACGRVSWEMGRPRF